MQAKPTEADRIVPQKRQNPQKGVWTGSYDYVFHNLAPKKIKGNCSPFKKSALPETIP